MLVYFLFYVSLVVEAAPVFVDRAETPEESNLALKRTLFGIVWTCFSTIIICAWSSVHPNVPPPSQWRAHWNRMRLMFWMVIAPELVLAWAVRQLFAARKIRDVYNSRYHGPPEWKWTVKHGHFFQMGGFSLVNRKKEDAAPNEQVTVLAFDYFEKHQDIEIPRVTAADIADRSKGDVLSKIIAILQTTWFIAQCIARGQQGLAVTELELATLALASLNAATFAIWWDKPLGVQQPVKIYYLKAGAKNLKEAENFEAETEKAEREDVVQQGPVNSRGSNFETSSLISDVVGESLNLVAEFTSSLHSGDGVVAFFLAFFLYLPIGLIYVITLPFFILFPIGTIFLLRVIKTEPSPQDTPSQSGGILANQMVSSLQRFRYRLTSKVSEFVTNSLNGVFTGKALFILFGWFIFLPLLFLFSTLFVILLIPFFALFFLLSFISTAVFGIVTTSFIPPGASHVPSFYALSTSSDWWSRMVVFALFGVVFGGLHCIGWNFKFLTHTEQTLWRSTSVAIAAIPLIVAPIDFILAPRLQDIDSSSCSTLKRLALLVLDLIMTILLFVYVPARLSLIAQALALLRRQPASALTAVDWTKYVPHLFSS